MISKIIKHDKRSKSKIKGKVLKSRIILSIDNMTISLNRIQAQRIHKTLARALFIQDTHKSISDNRDMD